MRRIAASLILVFCTILAAFAQQEGKVALEYGADFWYYFNNSEYGASNDALSGTIHAVVARPMVGFSITQSPAIKHKVMAGVDFSHDMGAGSAWKDYTKELVLYYEASVTSDKGTFTGLAGAFPRKALEAYYSEAFYTDEYCFQDRVLEGVLLKWRASDFYAELGCDWMGKLGHERRERFQIMTAEPGVVCDYLPVENSAFHRAKLDFQGSWEAMSLPHFSQVPLSVSLGTLCLHIGLSHSGEIVRPSPEILGGEGVRSQRQSVQGEGRVHGGERKQNKGNLLVLGPWHTLSFCLRTLE